MEYTKENLQELAESIYDLDAEVYAQLGSSLGRVSTVTVKAVSVIWYS